MSYITGEMDFHNSGTYQHQRKQLMEQLEKLQRIERNITHHAQQAAALIGSALQVNDKFIPRRKIKVNGDQVFCPSDRVEKDLIAAREILYDLMRETQQAREMP